MDGSFWAPICPDNYNPLGHINQIGYSKPSSLEIMTCVHDRCVEQCTFGVSVWADVGSGADEDVTLWATLANSEGLNVNSFIASQGYSNPPIDPFLCLKR
jgi:hypothetical protein